MEHWGQNNDTTDCKPGTEIKKSYKISISSQKAVSQIELVIRSKYPYLYYIRLTFYHTYLVVVY